LDAFYRRVHPGGPGWAAVARRHPDVRPDTRLGARAVDWLVGVVLVYAVLFGTGYALMGRMGPALSSLGVAAAASVFLYRRSS
ncbi:MAG TPA: hypothetical protein VNK41_11945, partial [Vicinamibacterales bacterium]|nr:hypothetical protein [Vicinamibacterales bacterium]